MSVFSLRGATVAYNGNPALRDVDLDVESGEAVAIVGPSGSGKTTLLRLLNGTLRPTDGAASVDGEDLSALTTRQLRKVRSRIGFVHQDLCLVPNLRVLHNVLSGRLGRHGFWHALATFLVPRRTVVRDVHEILQHVGIPEKLYERADALSGGQAQRVAIARALYQQPRALLADEPVSSVDPARAHDTVKLLSDISREKRITLCVSLHNLDLAREFFPRLVGLRGGRVVFDRPAGELSDDDFRALYQLGDGEILKDA